MELKHPHEIDMEFRDMKMPAMKSMILILTSLCEYIHGDTVQANGFNHSHYDSCFKSMSQKEW